MDIKKFKSPVGIAAYPWLNQPDTRYDADGVYQVNLILDKKDAQKLQDVVKEVGNGGRRSPVGPEYIKDENGDKKKTGKYSVRFKLKAKVKTKKGDSWEQAPILYDAEGTRVTDVKIGGGSKIQVSYEAIPYDQGEGGVTFRMKGVRILDLVEYQSSGETDDWSNEPKGSFVSSRNDSSSSDGEELEDDEDF